MCRDLIFKWGCDRAHVHAHRSNIEMFVMFPSYNFWYCFSKALHCCFWCAFYILYGTEPNGLSVNILIKFKYTCIYEQCCRFKFAVAESAESLQISHTWEQPWWIRLIARAHLLQQLTRASQRLPEGPNPRQAQHAGCSLTYLWIKLVIIRPILKWHFVFLSCSVPLFPLSFLLSWSFQGGWCRS